MLCITHDINDPYFNIASEEYLLKNFSDDIFMLYCNEPSIIVGKHQNTFAEINYWYIKEKKIKVVRRLSGGGTVFHDPGNLNFCFIRTGQEGSLVEFHKFSDPILEVLHKIGLPAERSGRNDLIINSFKFSGNAEHVYKSRTLHHGTLLFSSQLDKLHEALKVNAKKYQDKSVKSIPSKVTNIIDYLPKNITIENFQNMLVQHILSKFPEAKEYSFAHKDQWSILQLVNNKYSTWDWNFGYSPKCTFTNKGNIDGNIFDIKLEIDKGVIKEVDIQVNSKTLTEASKILNGAVYKDDIIREKLQELKIINTDSWLPFFF